MDPLTVFDDAGLPFSNRFGDHYYSRQDGRAECAHVFVAGNDLPGRWQTGEDFTVGELGFGTGLNFLETWSTWRMNRRAHQHLTFVSVDGFPLSRQLAREALSYWASLHPLSQKLIDHWDELKTPIRIDDKTTLDLRIGEASAMVPDFPKIDAWYLDGFAPSKNPEMWSSDLMHLVAERTMPGGTLASYTAAGWVRRNLVEAGFEVEKRPGFGTKRDMIVGWLRS